MKLVRVTVNSMAVSRPAPSPEHPQELCLDKGYDFAEVRRTLEEFGFTAHIRSRGEEAQAIKRGRFQSQALRGGRTHSWLNRFQHILVRWDKSPENYIAFLHFACALITLRAAGQLGLALKLDRSLALRFLLKKDPRPSSLGYLVPGPNGDIILCVEQLLG